MLRVAARNAELGLHAGPGGWNDPDILQVGLGLTATEGRTMFSLWAMMAAPLLAGHDVRRMDGRTRATLLNREVIAIDQDHAGLQGLRVTSRRGRDVWVAAQRRRAGGAVRQSHRGAAALSRKPESDVRRVPGRPLPGARPVAPPHAHDRAMGGHRPAHGAAMFRIRPLP